MTTIRRCTMSLPSDLVDKLDKLAAVSKVSRSALVAELLRESTDVLDAMIAVQVDSTPTGLRRFRGESISIVRDKVGQLHDMLNNDLFSGVDGD